MATQVPPTTAELWQIIQEQREEIRRLNARFEDLEAGRSGSDGATPKRAPERNNRSRGKHKLSRASLLKGGALGVVGLAGAEVAGSLGASSAEAASSYAAGTFYADGESGASIGFKTGTYTTYFTGYDTGVLAYGNSEGVYGIGTGDYSTGVYGSANVGAGVIGHSDSGEGVVGESFGSGGYGVRGSSIGTGIVGQSFGTGAGVIGVQGEIPTSSPGGFSAGVYGKNNGTNANGYGVQGTHAGGGWGGYFTSVSGIGAYGSTDSTIGGASAVQGEITSTVPGAGSAAVYGKNDGTTGNGYGVQGTHASGGWGGYFTSVSGIGAYGNGGTGTGVLGTSTSGIGIRGTSSSSVGCYGSSSSLYGVYGSSTNSHGVFGYSTNGMGAVGESVNSYGVYAQSTKSYGIHATGTTGVYGGGSTTGRGVIGAGGAAQLQLVPSTASSHPSSGQAGDFFVDASDRLWFSKGGSNWVQLA